MDFKKYADTSRGGLAVFSNAEPPAEPEEGRAAEEVVLEAPRTPGMDEDYEIVYRSFKRNPPQGILSALNAQKELIEEQIRITQSVCRGIYDDKPQNLKRYYADFLGMEQERAGKASDLAMLLLGTSGGILEEKREADGRVFDALAEIGSMAVESEDR